MTDRRHGAAESVVGSVTRYAASNIFRQLLGVFTAVLRPMLLTPEHYGLWNLLKAIPQYTSYSHLGAREAARYAIPYNQAAGRPDLNEQMENTIYWGALGLNLVPALGIAAFAAFGDFSGPERFGLLAVSVLVMVYWMYEHWLTLLKAYQRFTTISWGNVILPVGNFLTLALIWAFGVYGLFMSVVASLAAVTLYFRLRHPVRVERSFSMRVYLDLTRTGFPIMALGVVILMLRTVDRFVISSMLGNEFLGYYGIAVMILNFVMNVPVATREVIEPRLMQALDHDEPAAFMDAYFFKPLYTTAFAMPFLLGPVFYLAPPVIEWLLPRYAPGVPATQILCVGGYFLALVYITRGILVARRKQGRAAVIGLLAGVLNVGLSVALVRLGLGIEGVALASSLALAAFYASLHVYLRAVTGPGVAGWARAGLAMLWPLAVLVAPGALFRVFLVHYGLGGLAAAAVGLPVYYLAACIAVALCRRGNPLLSDFSASMVLSRLQRKKKPTGKTPPGGTDAS